MSVHPEGVQIVERYNKIDQYLARIYLTSTLATGFLFVMAAIAKGFYSFISKGAIVLQLPLTLTFPFDISNPWVFGLLFVWVAVALIFVALVSVAGEAFFAGLATNVVAHFKCIQQIFHNRNFKENDKSLIELIEYHKLVLDLSNKLMSAFRMIIFNHLMVASVLLCVLCFQLVMGLGTSLMLIIIYILYIAVIVIQITFFAYFGTLLTAESIGVADAIYCSNWYETTSSNRKKLLQCMMRAQIPVDTKAGLMEASLPNLKAIVNSAGSYVTLLLSFT
ncbi:odorant receptor 45a-like [Sabethes cyaneus]|uniref:odorant receptor 45a-like n=1 Tax=Sabethes cyaneus TaxID=53552 RepID=UPI00237D341D|nr:odorant receptor 45a-like [Sabethes cyaneus]